MRSRGRPRCGALGAQRSGTGGARWGALGAELGPVRPGRRRGARAAPGGAREALPPLRPPKGQPRPRHRPHRPRSPGHVPLPAPCFLTVRLLLAPSEEKNSGEGSKLSIRLVKMPLSSDRWFTRQAGNSTKISSQKLHPIAALAGFKRPCMILGVAYGPRF